MIESKYDVFICFKHSTEDGQTTEDSILAEQLYEYLTQRGFRVFFSTRELEFLGVSQYNVTINKALEASRFLIAVGCSRSNFESEWVQYEWSSFQNEIRSKTKQNGEVYVLYKGMAPKDLPYALRQHQAFNAADAGTFEKIGNFMANALKHRRTNADANASAPPTIKSGPAIDPPPIAKPAPKNAPPQVAKPPPSNAQRPASVPTAGSTMGSVQIPAQARQANAAEDMFATAPKAAHYEPHRKTADRAEGVFARKPEELGANTGDESIAPKWLSVLAKVGVIVIAFALLEDLAADYGISMLFAYRFRLPSVLLWLSLAITLAAVFTNYRYRSLNASMAALNLLALFLLRDMISTLAWYFSSGFIYWCVLIFIIVIFLSKHVNSRNYAEKKDSIGKIVQMIFLLGTSKSKKDDAGKIALMLSMVTIAFIMHTAPMDEFRTTMVYETPYIISAAIAVLSVYFLSCGGKKAVRAILELMMSLMLSLVLSFFFPSIISITANATSVYFNLLSLSLITVLPTVIYTLACLNPKAYLYAFGEGNIRTTLIMTAFFTVLFITVMALMPLVVYI